MGIFKREKDLIDKEIKIYREEKLLAVNKEVEEFMRSRHQEMRDFAIRCADDTKSAEHDYHYNQEQLGIKIAKLEAKKEHLKEITQTDKTAYERIIKDKDGEIERLNAILLKMVENQPNAIIQVKD